MLVKENFAVSLVTFKKEKMIDGPSFFCVWLYAISTCNSKEKWRSNIEQDLINS